jgi:hypothetical protein
MGVLLCMNDRVNLVPLVYTKGGLFYSLINGDLSFLVLYCTL